MVQVVVFAGLAEAAGERAVELPVELPAKVSDVKRAFAERFPAAAEQVKGCFAAVNQAYAGDEETIRPGDEVALLPPVSGG